MFEVVILVCLLNNDCVELHDTKGPYKTELECRARASEMMEDFVSAKPTPPTIGLRVNCNKKGVGI